MSASHDVPAFWAKQGASPFCFVPALCRAGARRRRTELSCIEQALGGASWSGAAMAHIAFRNTFLEVVMAGEAAAHAGTRGDRPRSLPVRRRPQHSAESAAICQQLDRLGAIVSGSRNLSRRHQEVLVKRATDSTGEPFETGARAAPLIPLLPGGGEAFDLDVRCPMHFCHGFRPVPQSGIRTDLLGPVPRWDPPESRSHICT